MTTQRRYILKGIVIVVCLIGLAYVERDTRARELVGTKWELQSYGEPDNLQSPTSAPTLAFGVATVFQRVQSLFSDRRSIMYRSSTTLIRASAECNRIDGGFTVHGSQLDITIYGMTQVGCVWSKADGTIINPTLHEMAYVDLLNEVQTYKRDGNTLILNTPDEILVFQRAN